MLNRTWTCHQIHYKIRKFTINNNHIHVILMKCCICIQFVLFRTGLCSTCEGDQRAGCHRGTYAMQTLPELSTNATECVPTCLNSNCNRQPHAAYQHDQGGILWHETAAWSKASSLLFSCFPSVILKTSNTAKVNNMNAWLKIARNKHFSKMHLCQL